MLIKGRVMREKANNYLMLKNALEKKMKIPKK